MRSVRIPEELEFIDADSGVSPLDTDFRYELAINEKYTYEERVDLYSMLDKF